MSDRKSWRWPEHPKPDEGTPLTRRLKKRPHAGLFLNVSILRFRAVDPFAFLKNDCGSGSLAGPVWSAIARPGPRPPVRIGAQVCGRAF